MPPLSEHSPGKGSHEAAAFPGHLTTPAPEGKGFFVRRRGNPTKFSQIHKPLGECLTLVLLGLWASLIAVPLRLGIPMLTSAWVIALPGRSAVTVGLNKKTTGCPRLWLVLLTDPEAQGVRRGYGYGGHFGVELTTCDIPRRDGKGGLEPNNHISD